MTLGYCGRVAMGLLFTACAAHSPPADPPVETYEGSQEPVPVQAVTLSEKPITRSVVDGEVAWQPFDRDAIAKARARGRPVMVAVLADWSVNAKVLAKEVLKAPVVLAALEEEGVVPFLADFTNEDEAIESYIAQYAKANVPLVVVYDRNGSTRTFDGSATAHQLATHLRASTRLR